MSEIIQTAFKSFWHFAGVALLFFGLLTFITNMFRKFLNYLTIRKNGYPPEHCDVEGDLKDNYNE